MCQILVMLQSFGINSHWVVLHRMYVCILTDALLRVNLSAVFR